MAYTAGPHIAFAAGQYAPFHEAGRRLLAHELAHVVQQTGASSAPLVQRVPFTPSSNEATVVKETQTTNEVRESVKTYCYEIVRNVGLDPDAWYAAFTSTNFLGIAVPDIHAELAAHLKERETFFLGKYHDADKARRSLGLIDMTWGGGRDYPTSAPISMHLFGLAVDVNYTENPFIGDSANPVFKRAGIMSDGKARSYHDGMSFEQLDALNDVLVDYFHFLDWNDIDGRLTELGTAAPPEFSGLKGDSAKAVVKRDLDTVARLWSRSSSKDRVRDLGFMRLTKEFKDDIGLSWGGSYGDIMHFDMRNANGAGQHGAAIQGAIGAYLAKAKAGAKKVTADDGHGGSVN